MQANRATENQSPLTSSLLPLWDCISYLGWPTFSFFLFAPPTPRHSMPFSEHPSSLLSLSLSQITVHIPTNSSQGTGFHHVFLCLQMSLWLLDRAQTPLRHSKYLWSFKMPSSLSSIRYVTHHCLAPGKEALCLHIQSTLFSGRLPSRTRRPYAEQPQKAPFTYNLHNYGWAALCLDLSAKWFLVQKSVVRIKWERSIYSLWVWFFFCI